MAQGMHRSEQALQQLVGDGTGCGRDGLPGGERTLGVESPDRRGPHKESGGRLMGCTGTPGPLASGA
jgi:hypothetical protein